jgi:KUP system potassium uptake protein
MLGLFGTALLYGDGMITPAISVLSAVEGLGVAAPSVERFVVPIACVILIGLFSVQARGTAAVGAFFGPVMVVWFFVLGVLGLVHIGDDPTVLRSLDPSHALSFFADNGLEGFLVLGSVFLVVTGGEALYADMGHFGRLPIQVGWFAIVLPGLFLNYLGQGALVLSDPEAAHNPFYLMAPSWARLPLTLLATGASVIASQALISGVFSITMQAVQLGYSPRLRIEHTSAAQAGQIYIPALNWALLASCIALVIAFGSSGALAAAYGVAVTATMFITTLLSYVVARERWGWSPAVAGALCGAFLLVDVAFLTANLFKIPDGGWFPLVVGVVVFVVLTTWRTGRALVREQLLTDRLPLDEFVAQALAAPVALARVEGTAVFMYSEPGMTPPALVANVRHNRVLHTRTVVLSVTTEALPRLPEGTPRVEVTDYGNGFCLFVARFGFMEEPELPPALAGVEGFDVATATYFLGAETVQSSEREGMARWRERLFTVMLRNATGAANFFHLPLEQTIVVGQRVDI